MYRFELADTYLLAAPSQSLSLTCQPSAYDIQFKSFVNTAFEPTMYSPHRAMFAVQGPTRWAEHLF